MIEYHGVTIYSLCNIMLVLVFKSCLLTLFETSYSVLSVKLEKKYKENFC